MLKALPHQGKWRLIDRVVELTADSVVAEGSFDQALVEGHFPGKPILPGVLLLEGLAQTMLVLANSLEPDPNGTPFLAGFDRVRFRGTVFPPATVRFEVKLQLQREGMTRAKGVAYCGEEEVCSATLTGAVR